MNEAIASNLDRRKGQWLKGVLDLCVLGCLRTGEVYGYELARMLAEAGLGAIKGGTLYPVLSRLETEGFVTVFWRASGQGPNRKYYTISEAGRELVDQAGKEWGVFAETAATLMAEPGEERC